MSLRACGNSAPQKSQKRSTRSRFVGIMSPGMMGHSMPASRQRLTNVK